uniref:Protein aurora borealis n=1 Tax=Romanomermis culicivorax TaxID=13658 RepID=A0A915IWM9_ROMCU
MESKNCSTPDHKFTRIRDRTPLELSRIQESPDSFDADIESRGASFVSTPISTRCGGTNVHCRTTEHHIINTTSIEKNKKTPLRKTKLNANKNDNVNDAPTVLTNPFEHYLLDKLHTHTCSPSIFAKVVSPNDEASNDGKFWSIDHIALINPADIDVSSMYHHSSMNMREEKFRKTPAILRRSEPAGAGYIMFAANFIRFHPARVDDETESRIQATVDQYFAESVIAPSPWCESMTSILRPKPRETSSLPNSPSSGVYTQSCNLNITVATQTMLTFKPELDLLALLGEKFLYMEENCQSKEMPSTSATSDSTPSIVGNSMRRKLFVSATKNKSRPKGRSPRRALQL